MYHESVALQGGQLKISYINLNSLIANSGTKVSEIEIFLKRKGIRIFGIGESKLDNTISNTDIYIEGYNITRNDFSRSSGGVLVYIDSTISYKRRGDLECLNDCIWIELFYDQQKFLCGFYYRNCSHNQFQFNTFVDQFRQSLSKVSQDNTPAYIFGDFNVHHNSWDQTCVTDNKGRIFKDVCDEFNFLQTITEHTYFSNRNSSLVDLILTNSLTYLADSKVEDFSLEKHCAVGATINLTTDIEVTPSQTVFDFNKMNIKGLSNYFAAQLSALDYDYSSSDELCALLTKHIIAGTKKYVPFFKLKANSPNKPWLTDALICQIQHRNALLRRFRKYRSDLFLEQYKEARNKVVDSIKIAKFSYYEKLNQSLSDPTTGNKKWHKIVNKFLQKGQCSTRVPPLKIGNTFTSNSLQKANVLNNHFMNMTVISSNNATLPELQYKTNARKESLEISEEVVLKNLLSIDCTKSMGPDQVSPHVLKNCAIALAPHVTKLFKKILASSNYPQIWKTANVLPLFKQGDASDPNNYRPISMISVLGKQFEKIVHNQLYAYFTSNNLLSVNQSGFIKGDSCVNRLMYLIDYIYQKLELGKQIPIIFLDIKKAFDKVWHRGLLHKLKINGITGSLLKLLTSYLSNRKQRVVIDGVISEEVNLLAGVPQGGILSTLLFLIFINDITEVLITSKMSLFADDSSLYTTISYINDNNLQIMQRELAAIEKWANDWCVEFNPNKCKLMVFCKKTCTPIIPMLYFFNTILENVNSYTYLGLTLDTKLNWSKHTDNVVSKCKLILNIMKQYKYVLSRNTLKIIYILHCRSIIDYAGMLLSNMSIFQMKRLEGIQYNAMLTVTGSHFGTSEQKLRFDLGWLSVEQLQDVQRLVFLYKIVYNYLPNYLKSLLPTTQAQQRLNQVNLRTSNLRPLGHRNPDPLMFVESRGSVSFCSRPMAKAIRQWNMLELSVRQSNSVESFRNKVIKAFNLPKNRHFDTGKRYFSCILTQLRLGVNLLNHSLFTRQLIETPECNCGEVAETVKHFFLHCPHYLNLWLQLFLIIDNITQNNDISFFHLNDSVKLDILLKGLPQANMNVNTSIIRQVQVFLCKSKRFKN